MPSPGEKPPVTKPDRSGRRFPPNRTFRFAIPSLRLKSGVRFELVNLSGATLKEWEVRFYFGTSKEICNITLNEGLRAQLASGLAPDATKCVEAELRRLHRFLKSCDVDRMQLVWSHRGPGGTRPLDVLDRIGACGAAIIEILRFGAAARSEAAVMDALTYQYGKKVDSLPGVAKLVRNASLIHAGMLVGTTANRTFKSPLLIGERTLRRASG